MNVHLGIAISHRRTASWFAILAAACCAVAFTPGALALDQVVDATVSEVVDATVSNAGVTDTTVVDPPPPPPPADPVSPGTPVDVVEPPPAPPEAATPPPPPPAEPLDAAPPAPLAPPEPQPAPTAPTTPAETTATPDAPQEPAPTGRAEDTTFVVGDPVAKAAETNDPGPTTQRADAPATASATPDIALPVINGIDAPTAPEPVVAGSGSRPLQAPMVLPMARRLTHGLGPGFAPAVDPSAPSALPGASVTAAPSPGTTAKASEVQSDLIFGAITQSGGSSESGAGLLAMLLALMPLGLPDGKFSMGADTQVGWLLVGTLLVVLPFFASPIRDRRRRGSQGFAALSLRPG